MCINKARFWIQERGTKIQGGGAAGLCSTLKRDSTDIEAGQKIQAQKC